MEIENCVFPDDLYYDLENLTWIRKESGSILVIGITPILSTLAGRLSAITFRPINTVVQKGKSLGTIESGKFFGVVRSPIAGKIVSINSRLIGSPKLANDSPYRDGWFVELEPSQGKIDSDDLKSLPEASDEIRTTIRTLRLKCYSALPDFEMSEIGIECAATLLKLDEMVSQIAIGQVIHLISDDPTADIEMTRWSEETGQQLLETRNEDNLCHFIIKKIK
jgi:glycine cleavage system H protein